MALERRFLRTPFRLHYALLHHGCQRTFGLVFQAQECSGNRRFRSWDRNWGLPSRMGQLALTIQICPMVNFVPMAGGSECRCSSLPHWFPILLLLSMNRQ